MTLAIHGDFIDSYCQTVQGSVLNIHLFFNPLKSVLTMKNNLKSLLSAENIQVLVADDMAVIKGGGGKGGGGRGGSGSGKGHGRGGSGSGKGHGHGGHGGNCGWGRCRPRKGC
jgi:hypothetical protein